MKLPCKITFLGGKGGVGKTTLSSALALIVSEEHRTLLISTDPAHSLSDIFSAKGEGVRPVSTNLHILEIDPSSVLREYVERAISVIRSSVSPESLKMVEDSIRHIADTPGAEEVALTDSLIRTIKENYHLYDLFVVDTAPTGHTLHMIKSMSIMSDWLEKLIAKRRDAGRLWSASGVTKEDRSIEILEDRKRRYAWFLEELRSGQVGFIPVLIPERLPLEETKRLLKEITSMGLRVNVILVNRVLPEGVEGAFFKSRKEVERLYLDEIEKSFSRYRLVKIPMMEKDITSPEDLMHLASYLKGVADS